MFCSITDLLIDTRSSGSDVQIDNQYQMLPLAEVGLINLLTAHDRIQMPIRRNRGEIGNFRSSNCYQIQTSSNPELAYLVPIYILYYHYTTP